MSAVAASGKHSPEPRPAREIELRGGHRGLIWIGIRIFYAPDAGSLPGTGSFPEAEEDSGRAAAFGKAGYWLCSEKGAFLYLGCDSRSLWPAEKRLAAYEAAHTYLCRRDKMAYPVREDVGKGHESLWRPDPFYEKQACCEAVEAPSQRAPYSLLEHCRSAAHVGEMKGIEADAVVEKAHLIDSVFEKTIRRWGLLHWLDPPARYRLLEALDTGGTLDAKEKYVGNAAIETGS